MDIDDHFNHVVEMVKLGSESFRKVEAFHLSRMACMIISENADSRKLLVKQTRAYFSQSVSITELMQNSLESNILRFHFMKKSICIKTGHIGSSWSKRLRKMAQEAQCKYVDNKKYAHSPKEFYSRASSSIGYK